MSPHNRLFADPEAAIRAFTAASDVARAESESLRNADVAISANDLGPACTASLTTLIDALSALRSTHQYRLDALDHTCLAGSTMARDTAAADETVGGAFK